MKTRKRNRLMALALCLCMMVTMLPITVSAQEGKTYNPTDWEEVQGVIESMNSGDTLDISGIGSDAKGKILSLKKNITIQGNWDIFNDIEGSYSIRGLHFVIENGANVTIRELAITNDDLLSIISGTGNLTLHGVYFSYEWAKEVEKTPLPIIDLKGDVTIYGTAEENPVDGVAVSTTIQGKSIEQSAGNHSAGDAIHAKNVTIYGGTIGGGDDFGYRGSGGTGIVASGKVKVIAKSVWGTEYGDPTLYSGVNLLGGTGKNGADGIVAGGDVFIEGGSVSGGNGEGLNGEGGSAIRSGGNVTLSGQWLQKEGAADNASFTDTFLWAGFGNYVPGVPIILTGNDQMSRQELRINGAKVCGRNKGQYAAPYTFEMNENDLAIIDNSLIGWYTDIPIFSAGFYQITNPVNTWGTLDNATEYKVTKIEIADTPQKTVYTEGDMLDLSGLSARLIYSDNNKVKVPLEDFNANNISTTPKNGDRISVSDTAVTVSMGDQSTTFNITVNAKQQQVQAPSFSPKADTYQGAQKVEITCDTEGASIYYTTDSSVPTSASTLYSGAIAVDRSLTLKAVAVKTGMKDSEVATATYTIQITPTHTHSWAATWTENDSHHWHECTADDCPITENSEKIGYGAHIESEWITTQEPTETDKGSKKKECTICGHRLETKEIPTLDPDHVHSLTYIQAKTATCAEAGHTKYYYCTGCGKYFSDTEGKKDIELSVTVIRATGNHTSNGNWQHDAENHWKRCSVCNQEVDKAAHSGGTANCHQKAACEVCDAEYGSRNPEKHDGDTKIKGQKDATETEKGYTGDIYCLGCDKLLKQGEVIPKLEPPGHTHTFGGDWQFDDKNHWQLCTEGDTEIGNKAAHTAGRWIDDKKLSENELSKRHQKCTVCGCTMATEIKVKTDGKAKAVSDKDGLWTFYGNFEDLKAIRLNGTLMGIEAQSSTRANLTYPGYEGIAGMAKAGSVKVTLYADFLKTLPTGTYTLEVEFASGKTTSIGSAKFIVSNDKKPEPKPDPNDPAPTSPTDVPATGDTSHLRLWVLLMLAALAVCGSLLAYWRISSKKRHR